MGSTRFNEQCSNLVNGAQWVENTVALNSKIGIRVWESNRTTRRKTKKWTCTTSCICRLFEPHSYWTRRAQVFMDHDFRHWADRHGWVQSISASTHLIVAQNIQVSWWWTWDNFVLAFDGWILGVKFQSFRTSRFQNIKTGFQKPLPRFKPSKFDCTIVTKRVTKCFTSHSWEQIMKPTYHRSLQSEVAISVQGIDLLSHNADTIGNRLNKAALPWTSYDSIANQ